MMRQMRQLVATVRRAMCAAALPAAGWMLAGCAYFNGVYNAKQAEHKADYALRRGNDGEAAGQFGVAAIKAETVLVRYPKSRWADDALYLAGRGWAYAGRCDHAAPMLVRFLALGGQPPSSRERATLALGMCLVRSGQPAEGRQALAPVVGSGDRDVSSDAALWSARASMALGETDSALVFLHRASESAAEWELAAAYLGQARYAAAESLLTIRALAGDTRQELYTDLTRLWDADQADAVERLVARYDAARTPAGEKGRLHLLAGDLLLRAGNDSGARRHLMASQRFARDSVTGRETAARLLLLAVDSLPSTADVEQVIRVARSRAGGTNIFRRLDDNLLLVRMLESRTDFTGSSLFLAAEVARDSLRARALAHTLFMEILRTVPNVPVAPKALLAAAALKPDSAAAYDARLRSDYRGSPYLSALDGTDNPRLPPVHADELLQQTWTLVLAQYSDSLTKLRIARGDVMPSAPAAGSGRAPP